MLSGISDIQLSKIYRMNATAPKSNKRLLGQNGLQNSLFNSINQGRYATNGTNPVWGNNPGENYDPYGLNNPDGMPPEGMEGGDPIMGTGNVGNEPVNDFGIDPTNDPAFKPKTEKTKDDKKTNKKPGEMSEDEAKELQSQGEDKANEAKSGLGGIKSQTSDTRSQTATTETDATNSKSDKKSAIAKEKQVKNDLKNMEKEKKAYDKELKKVDKQFDNVKKKIQENDNLMQEQMSRAESLQDSAGEDGGVQVRDEMASIAQNMAGVAAETKKQSQMLDKSVKTQKDLRTKSVKSAQKLEKSFDTMITVGKEYQTTNDKTQKTADVVSKVSSAVSTAGQITSYVGEGIQSTGIALQATPYTVAAGVAMEATGITVDTVGDIANYVGMAGSLAAGVTTYVATDARQSIDSFTDTSKDAYSDGKSMRKDIVSTEKNIKALNKENSAVRKDAAKFEAMAMKVATMDGAGNLSLMSGGGSTTGIGGAKGTGAGASGGASGMGIAAGTNPFGATTIRANNTNQFEATGGNNQIRGTNPFDPTDGEKGRGPTDISGKTIPNGGNPLGGGVDFVSNPFDNPTEMGNKLFENGNNKKKVFNFDSV